jgi:hypothetical protein
VQVSHATDDISGRALKSFQKTFSNAKEAAWTVTEKHYKVTFILNNETLTAFYNPDGRLIGVTRNISSLQLPIILQTELKGEYGRYWITELVEQSGENGTDYYVTVEDADSRTVLKSSSGNTSWSVYRKLRKS